MEIELSVKRPFMKLTLSELLCRLKCEQSTIYTDALYLEFYNRYAKDFYKKCLILYSNYKCDESRADDLFQEVMVKAANAIPNFEYSDTDSETVIDKKIRGWLGRIANNELTDIWKANSGVRYTDNDEELDAIFEENNDGFSSDEHIEISYERLQLQELLSQLSDRDRYLLKMLADYGCIDSRRHLPDEVLERLCSELNITKGNLRQIKLRLSKKIELLKKN